MVPVPVLSQGGTGVRNEEIPRKASMALVACKACFLAPGPGWTVVPSCCRSCCWQLCSSVILCSQAFFLFPRDPDSRPRSQPRQLMVYSSSANKHWRYHLCRLTQGSLLAYHKCLGLKICTQNLVSGPISPSIST